VPFLWSRTLRISFAVGLAWSLARLGAGANHAVSAATSTTAIMPHAVTARGRSFAIATDQHLASATGARVLRDGGNAVDAAVAIGYALAATYPAAGNLGGGGFMLIHLKNGTSHFIDFREVAPAAARADMYLDPDGRPDAERSTVGALSAGVPGTVAGLEYARTRYGTFSRETLIAPAIAFADGFTLDAADARVLAADRELLARFPSTTSIFMRHGATLPDNTRLRQPDLARTLRAIARLGSAGFYRGEVARRLVASTRAAGGIISLADLAGYRARERAALTCTHAGQTIVTAPPPSSGGVAICETLGIIGAASGGTLRDVKNAQLEIEAERRAFADRSTALGDPGFVRVPVAQLLAGAYLSRERASIVALHATPSSALAGFRIHEGHNTTNYSVVDAAGNAVDVTYTLNNSFGSGFVAAGTGVLLNDEMDDFTSKPGEPNMFGLVQGEANAIAPGKRPLSSMSPTIVLDREGRVRLVAGAAGGPRIITATLDIVRAVFDFHEDLARAVAQPRAHMQWLPDRVFAQSDAFSPRVAKALRKMGYHLQFGRAGSLANAVGVAADGTMTAAHDPRSATGSAVAL
jgi:gamma-glutamyltranspeptidase/glutathione hydrolase